MNNLMPIYERVKEIVKDKSIIDIGCGDGHYSCLFYGKYCGIDIDSEMIKTARSLNSGRRFLYIDAIESVRFFKYFDFITAFEFLEHVEYDIELIEMIPAGKDFIFSVPNYWSKNHIRIYDENIINERYLKLLDIIFIEELVIYKRVEKLSNIIYLCYAKRKL